MVYQGFQTCGNFDQIWKMIPSTNFFHSRFCYLWIEIAYIKDIFINCLLHIPPFPENIYWDIGFISVIRAALWNFFSCVGLILLKFLQIFQRYYINFPRKYILWKCLRYTFVSYLKGASYPLRPSCIWGKRRIKSCFRNHSDIKFILYHAIQYIKFVSNVVNVCIPYYNPV